MSVSEKLGPHPLEEKCYGNGWGWGGGGDNDFRIRFSTKSYRRKKRKNDVEGCAECFSARPVVVLDKSGERLLEDAGAEPEVGK